MHQSFESIHKSEMLTVFCPVGLLPMNSVMVKGVFCVQIFIICLKAMKPAKRLSFTCLKQLCDNCLLPGHFSGNCKLECKCSVPECGKKHRKSLHIIPRQDSFNSTSTRSAGLPGYDPTSTRNTEIVHEFTNQTTDPMIYKNSSLSENKGEMVTRVHNGYVQNIENNVRFHWSQSFKDIPTGHPNQSSCRKWKNA